MGDTPRHSARRDKKKAQLASRDKLRNRRIARIMGLFIALVVAFAAGFFVRSQSVFVSSLGFPVGENEASSSATTTLKTTYDSVSQRVAEVEDMMATNSMDSYDVQQATDSILDALMKSTEDPYAAYFNSERYAAYLGDTSDRSYAGIGVLFAEYNGRAYVADVFEGSEAEAKGVVQGDFVQAIDGDGKNWTMTEVVNSLSRGEGEEVVITWMHPTSLDAETGDEFTTTLTCRSYEEENVTTALTNDVGYIRLHQITQNSADLVRNAVNDLTSRGAVSFVLDIRDNPGGYLTQAVDIASMFVKSGVLVEIETVDGVTTKTATGTTATDAPLVVLVNEYTSAAAEVLAAALQDNQRATVVGQTTMGKGSVQVMRELSFGGAVRYTAAYYHSPLGHDINDVGVMPSVMVSSDSEAEVDTQRLVAVDTAHSLVP